MKNDNLQLARAKREEAHKEASMLDARVALAIRDLEDLKGKHREAVGYWRGLDVMVTFVEQDQLAAQVQPPKKTRHGKNSS